MEKVLIITKDNIEIKEMELSYANIRFLMGHYEWIFEDDYRFPFKDNDVCLIIEDLTENDYENLAFEGDDVEPSERQTVIIASADDNGLTDQQIEKYKGLIESMGLRNFIDLF